MWCGRTLKQLSLLFRYLWLVSCILLILYSYFIVCSQFVIYVMWKNIKTTFTIIQCVFTAFYCTTPLSQWRFYADSSAGFNNSKPTLSYLDCEINLTAQVGTAQQFHTHLHHVGQFHLVSFYFAMAPPCKNPGFASLAS